jgi:hypothetical protein
MLILEIAIGVFLGGWALAASVAYWNARCARREFADKMRGLDENQILMLMREADTPEEMVTMIDNMLEHNRIVRRLFPDDQAAGGSQYGS